MSPIKEKLKIIGLYLSGKAPEPQLFDFEKQYLGLIGWFSPFLRSISGKKSRSPMVGVLTVPGTIISLVGDNTNHREISNHELSEYTSSGKVYFTRGCISSGWAARQCIITLLLLRPRRWSNVYRNSIKFCFPTLKESYVIILNICDHLFGVGIF